jgi:hypothetical protein
MFIDTRDTVIKAVKNTEHYSQNFKDYSQQESLFSHIHFFVLITLTPLEPITSLTPHYAVPSSICRIELARCFASAPHNLSLLSPRILRYLLALSSRDGSLAFLWTLAVSPWAVYRHPLVARRVSVRRLPVGRLTRV